MPRLVDHEQRRREITTAIRRVIARGGLEAATFQTVAAEAGISVRLVQYYFGTKREFLLATHQAVVLDAGKRMAAALGALGENPAPREVLRTIIAQLLPLDQERRDETVIFAAYHAASLTGSPITGDDNAGAALWLVDACVEQLRRQRAVDGASTIRPELDGELIAGAVAGLSAAMVQQPARYTPEAARILVDRLLERTLGAE
ncbi:TetR/AcrR family transcriptional regulator [Nocardia crassostreae]|uniref:TetR/AcrR family transcriptional regulator n=1 Tax=Nocardia crassostreae TaxID=53428 RepID=UPI00082F3AD2|nr:TetR/AcrR family transcriptional regulator [Nocardia crassostreae]